MDSIHIHYLVNCGLLLQTEQTILMDGLFRASLYFSDMSSSLKTKLQRRIPPFDRIDHLVFTHGHPDHFSLEETEAYLKRNPVKTLILPPESGEPDKAVSCLRQIIPQETAFICPRSEVLEPYPICELGDVRLIFLNTPHIEAPFYPKYHYSVLLKTGDLRVFFSADSDFPDETYLDFLKEQSIDYGFFNPFFLMHKKGLAVLRTLNLKHSFIYHIPYRDSNNTDFLDMIYSAFSRRHTTLPPTSILTPDMPAFRLSKNSVLDSAQTFR